MVTNLIQKRTNIFSFLFFSSLSFRLGFFYLSFRLTSRF